MSKILNLCPILPAAVGIVVGILAYGWLPVWLAVPVIAIAVWLYIKKWQRSAATLLFVAIGMILCALQRPGAPLPEIFNHKVTASARILAADENPQSVSLLVDVDSIQHIKVPTFKALITVNSPTEEYDPGMRLQFSTAFTPLPPPPMLPGDLDLSLYYKAEGISALAYCNEADCRITAPASAIENAFTSARKRLTLALLSSHLSDDCKTFLLATLLGDDAFLSPDTKLTFRRAGVSHLLALSGLHVGIVVIIVMMLTIPLNLGRWGFYIRPLIAIIFVWCYAMLVGMPPSVVRAAIMTSVYMLARLIQRGHTGINSLAISIVFILAIRPFWIYSIGFQLSVAAVASILAFTSLVPKKWQKYPVRYFILMSLLVPVAAIAGTGLISYIYCSSFPLLFLPANLAVGLLTPWILGFGAAVMIFSLLGWQLIVIAWVTTKLYTLLSTIITYIGALPGAEISGTQIHAFVVVPYTAMVVSLWLAIQQKSWRWAAASICSCALTCLIAIILTPARPSSELYILPEKDATKIILYTSGSAFLILPDKNADREEILQKANRQHQGYLSLRTDNDSFTLRPTPRQITIDSLSLRIISEIADTAVIPNGCPATHILICKGYKDSISALWQRLRPATILLSPALHPKTTKRIIKECTDTIPVINLRQHPFSFTPGQQKPGKNTD